MQLSLNSGGERVGELLAAKVTGWVRLAEAQIYQPPVLGRDIKAKFFERNICVGPGSSNRDSRHRGQCMADTVEYAVVSELEATIRCRVPSIPDEECDRGKTEQQRKKYQELCSHAKRFEVLVDASRGPSR